MRSGFIIIAAIAIAGCGGDFSEGDPLIVRVERDAYDPCLIHVTKHVYGSIDPITARIVGCISPVKPGGD